MAAASVSGAARRADSSRAPAPVTVRSMALSRLPPRSPDMVMWSSRLRRVALSMAIMEPWASTRGGLSRGKRPFWVSST